MIKDCIGFLLIFLSTVFISIRLGLYLKKVYKNEKSILDFLKPAEKVIFKICSI